MARILLIGPGAIGGTVGFAAGGKHDLVIAAHTKFETLALTRTDTGERKAVPVKVVTSPSDAVPVDWVAGGGEIASDAVHRRMAQGGSRAAYQSRDAAERRGASRAGRAVRAAGHACRSRRRELPAERTAPGEIATHGGSALTVPDDAAGREFTELFAGSFVKVNTDADFKTREWEKLCLNCAGGALSVLALRPDALASSPEMTALGRALIAESMTVGRAEGAKFADVSPISSSPCRPRHASRAAIRCITTGVTASRWNGTRATA